MKRRRIRTGQDAVTEAELHIRIHKYRGLLEIGITSPELTSLHPFFDLIDTLLTLAFYEDDEEETHG